MIGARCGNQKPENPVMHHSTAEVSRYQASLSSGDHPKESPSSPKVIVYLEDNDDDCFLLRHALRSAGVPCRLEIMRTAVTARTFLSDAANVPHLVICDLGLGESSGLEFAHWVRQQSHLAEVPVMLVTGSLSPAQIARASQVGVNACVEKSVDLGDLTGQIARFFR
jgi:CheY-like chemotaxis protein